MPYNAVEYNTDLAWDYVTEKFYVRSVWYLELTKTFQKIAEEVEAERTHSVPTDKNE